LYSAEAGTQVALQAIQALGGNGYINEYPTGRYLRDAKLYEIGAGTSEVRRSLIGRRLNEEYMVGLKEKPAQENARSVREKHQKKVSVDEDYIEAGKASQRKGKIAA